MEMARRQGSFILRKLSNEQIDLSKINYLEFGAGRGWVLSYLQSFGSINSTMGIEPDEVSVRWGRENLEVNLNKGTLNEDLITEISLNYPETNLISLIHVLEHLHNPFELLALLKKNLKEHFLFLEIPNAEQEGPVMKIDTFPWSSMGQHFWSFSAKSLRLSLENCGYQIISLETEGNPHYWDRSIERLSLWNRYFNFISEKQRYGDLNLMDFFTATCNLVARNGIIKVKSLVAPKYTRLDLPIIRILAKSA
ncbi:MAG: class I SAM-dependent methyltransferase [Methanoculleus sp.]|nr:class I SAM-dependent methyltransferase [Methanoculleus sp.]